MGRFVIEDEAPQPRGRFVVEDDSRNTEIARGAKLTNAEADQYMQNRAKFASEGGVSTFGKKGATDTRKISYTDTGYRPNKKATNAKELAKNFVQDVVELPLMPVRMADQIANSPDTPQTLADIGKGLVTTPLSFIPYAGEALGGTSAENAWLTNPGLGALTIAGVTGAVKGIKGGSSLADIAPDTAAPLADRVATKLYDMTLKQGTTLKPEIRAANVKLGLEGEYLPNAKGVDKLASDIAATEGQLGEGIAAGEAAKVTGTLDRAIANIEALRPAANRSANPVKANAMIDAEIARLRGNPMQGTDGAIPIGEMQKMKVEQGRSIRYQERMNQPVDPFKTTIDKARVRGLREELETRLSDAFPELADTNKKLGGMYQLQGVLERAANRIENNQGIGIGLPIKGGAGAAIGGMIGGPTGAAIGSGVGALIGIIEHPSVAPRLAIALYRHSRGRLSKAQATAMVNDRLDKMKTDLVQREQTVLDSEALPKVSNGNLGDTIDPTAYAPEYGWEGKPPAAPEVANPEVLPPRQSSQMPVISDQGGRIVPQVETMTKRIPQGFNPEVAGTEESQLGDRLAPQPKPLRSLADLATVKRNVGPENTQNHADLLGSRSQPIAKTDTHPWRQYVAENMSRAMKEEGSHGAAMKKLAKEWGEMKVKK